MVVVVVSAYCLGCSLFVMEEEEYLLLLLLLLL